MTYLIKYSSHEALLEATNLREAGRLAEERRHQGEKIVGIHERPDLEGTAWRIIVNSPELLHRKARHA